MHTTVSFAQNFHYPAINKKARHIKDFIPVGWTILDSATGDLNNDNHADAVVILQRINNTMLIDQENGIEDSATTKPRILIILFRDNSGHLFHLAEQNNTFVLTYLDLFADDPYQSISIKKGILGIEFYYYPFSGNWLNRHSYQFSYQKKEFLLIGAEYEESNKATHDFNKYSYNFIQNKRLFSTGNWDRKTKKTEAISLKNPGRQTLKSLQRPYNWEVEPGVYL